MVLPRRHRAQRAGRLWTCLLLIFTWLVAFPATAEAADPTVEVRLDAVTPSVLRLSGDLTLTGRITNTSDVELSGLRVQLWSSRGPITNVDALNLALHSSDYAYAGALITQDPRGNIDLTTDGPLAPGETRPFSVTATIDDGPDPLRLNSTRVAYLVGAQVRQTTGRRTTTLGSARTLLPSLVAGTQLESATVVLLNAPPRMIVPPLDDEQAVFSDDDLATELTGRLGDLLRLAEAPGTTLAIDPELYDEITAMTDGYTVAGTSTQGTGVDAAIDFRQRLDAVLARGQAYRTLYGSPDVAVAIASGQRQVIEDAVAALTPDHPLAHLPLVVLPEGQTTSETLLDQLAVAEPDLVIAENLSTTNTVQRGYGNLLISTPPDLFDGGPSPAPTDTAPQVLGRFQSYLVVAAAQRQIGVAVVRTSHQAAIAATPADWLTTVPLQQVVAELSPGPVGFGDIAQPASRSSELLDLLARSNDEIRLWGDLTQQPELADQLARRTFLLAWNDLLTTEPEIVHWVTGVTAEQTAAIEDGSVEIHTTQQWVLTAENNALPVTITNNLPITVTVRVVFDSQNPARVDVPNTGLVTIAPDETASVRVEPEARSNGVVEVNAHLETAGGHQLGPTVPITVEANSSGRVAWLIIIASGVVLLVATFLRVRQVRRAAANRRGAPTIAEPAYSAQPGGPEDPQALGQADLDLDTRNRPRDEGGDHD